MILNRVRDQQSYLIQFSSQSRSTLKQEQSALKALSDFCKDRFDNGTIEELVEELQTLKDRKQENTILEILQSFINHLHSSKLNPKTIQNYSKRVKNYLNYRLDVRIHNEDLRRLKFPKQDKRKPYPLKLEEAKKILDCASEQKGLYLFLMSSGMRIEEACQLRKRDFTSGIRYKVHIPAKYTKTRQERITFVSKEAEPYIKEILDSKKDDDLVFVTNEDPLYASINEMNRFVRVRKNAKLDHLKYDSGISKITIHSFRSYFISKSGRVELGLGHALAGHDYYMKQYDRYTDEELLQFYLKAEPYLAIYGSELLESHAELKTKVEEMTKKIDVLEYGSKARDSEFLKAVYAFEHGDKTRLLEILIQFGFELSSPEEQKRKSWKKMKNLKEGETLSISDFGESNGLSFKNLESDEYA
ncbi:MAG: site-specific integrase [Thaumarchaeota archaeon]|nr:site-specific integrase [Nitrososphaerota archaeon]